MVAKNILIGAGGFIGSNLLERLISHGSDVIAIDRKFTNQIIDNVHYIGGDGLDLSLYDHINFESSTLIYLGGNSRPSKIALSIYDEINLESKGFLQLCEYAGKRGISKIIFCSSGGTIYGESISEINFETDLERPINFYGFSKLLNEQALRLLSFQYNFQSVALRLSNPFGPRQFAKEGQGFIAAAMSSLFENKQLKIWGDGRIVRDFIYIDDVVQAFISALNYEGGNIIANIGTSIGYSLLDVCSTITEVSGRSLDLAFESSRSVDVSRNVLSNRVARDLLFWQPQVDFKSGIFDTYVWWKNHADCQW